MENFKNLFILSSYILLALLALALWNLSCYFIIFFIYSVHFGLGDICEYKTALTKKYQLYLGIISHGELLLLEYLILTKILFIYF